MVSGRLDAVFLDEPPEGALRPPEDVFPTLSATAWLDDVEAGVGGPQPAKPQGCGDADERTYLATQVLPEGRGAFGYLAVSLANGGPHWEGAAQGPAYQGAQSSPAWGRGEPQAASTPLEASPAGPDGPAGLAVPREVKVFSVPPCHGHSVRPMPLHIQDGLVRIARRHSTGRYRAEPLQSSGSSCCIFTTR